MAAVATVDDGLARHRRRRRALTMTAVNAIAAMAQRIRSVAAPGGGAVARSQSGWSTADEQ